MNDGEVDIQGAGDELLVSRGIRDITLSENGFSGVSAQSRPDIARDVSQRHAQITLEICDGNTWI